VKLKDKLGNAGKLRLNISPSNIESLGKMEEYLQKIMENSKLMTSFTPEVYE